MKVWPIYCINSKNEKLFSHNILVREVELQSHDGVLLQRVRIINDDIYFDKDMIALISCEEYNKLIEVKL